MRIAFRRNYNTILSFNRRAMSGNARCWRNAGFLSACADGDTEVVEEMIARGGNEWNKGLCIAGVNNHVAVAELLLKNGANNFDEVLLIACQNGNKKLASLMITYGATNLVEAKRVADRFNHTCLRDFIHRCATRKHNDMFLL